MENLKCTVMNCVYNSDTYCTAEHITVYPVGDGFANTSDGTGCRTFKPRNNRSTRDME